MDVKRKYIKEAGYDVAEDFVETLKQLDIRTGIKIAKFIEKNVDNYKPVTIVRVCESLTCELFGAKKLP